MPKTELPLSLRRAAVQLGARLRQRTGQVPERLDAAVIKMFYPQREYVVGWRVGVIFPDEVIRRIDVVATNGFPSIPVRTALVDRPSFMTWPHVEEDGILCLLPNVAECDPDDPCAVAENLLNRSVRLVEELVEGSTIERDFCDEFLTYWAYKAHKDGSNLFSLVAPQPPSRVVRLWRGQGLEVIGEDNVSLARWVHRRFGHELKVKTEEGAFIWLPKPPLPAEYPETASDLRSMALSAGDDAAKALDRAAIAGPNQVVAMVGAPGRGGPGLIAVKVPNPKKLSSHPRSATSPLNKGFRSGRTPDQLLLNRFFGTGRVIRSSVQRADSNWVHGRGQDSRTPRLLDSSAVVVGCGSVGAPVALTLAQAGVGRIFLIDPDDLSWPNVGRHPLGATAIGRNKAEALAERLQADFPHLCVEGRASYLEPLLQRSPELLDSATLIVASTGSWAAESALNRWHVEQGRTSPILYCWMEAHACAGHAVAIARNEGCFQCHIGRTGSPSFKVVNWPDQGDVNREEPACGAHYNPYGPGELSQVTAMMSNVALDCLLRPPSHSFSRVFATSQHRVEELGGRFSDDWIAEMGESESGIRSIDRPWLSANCPVCLSQPVDEAA